MALLLASALLFLPFGCATSAPGGPAPWSPAALADANLLLDALLREAKPATPPQGERDRLLTYAYRSADDEALLSALDSLVAEKKLAASAGGELVHFFAAALKDRPGAVGELRRREAAASGEAREALAAVTRTAADFSSPAPDSATAVDALWAEYRALGREETLKAVIGVLALPPSDENEALVIHAAVSLVGNLAVHGNLSPLEQSLRGASGRQRVLLGLVLDRLRDRRETASRHTFRGDNLNAENKRDAALEEYLSAIESYPAHHPAHTALGRHFERAGNIPKALWHAETARLLAGDDPYVLSNLGRVLYRQRRYAEARRHLEQALGSNPAWPYPYYQLGLVHEALGDRKQAAAFFAKSLEIEPHGSCSGDARRHLARMNASVPASATDLVRLLRERKFAEIEQRLADLLEGGAKNRDGASLLYLAYEELAVAPRNDAAFKARLRELEAWLAARPDSHFAHGALGDCNLEYAFFGRGSGWASSVTAEGRQRLQERLLTARAHLERAYELDPSDPAPPAFQIRVAMGLSLGLDEVDRLFRRSTTADATFSEVYFRKLDYLSPHWHGSPEVLLAFARESAARAPAGSIIPRVLSAAHWIVRDTLERRGQDAVDYFRDPAIWAELKSSHERILGDYPDSSRLRNWYARDAYHAGDLEIARRQFELIGNDWHERCWKTFTAFQEAKRKALAPR